ncbi:thiamine transporter 1-like isoform X2 [Daphnia pulex]|uniref:thiamine transporter 1-like isoform X2 n=1 Tax=Daphnia pulex TaxID=6669 RepID=UPI001EDE101B|nr:thiamine transporter 1-like isoform X2 [Daphnia pulex]
MVPTDMGPRHPCYAVEFMYAASTASKVAYSTYIYTQVPVEKFQIVTAYTKAALLAGRCIAGILGQILVATDTCDYLDLNYISLGFVSFSTLFACLLPSVSRSIYFHRGKVQESSTNNQLLVQLETPKELHSHHDEVQCSKNLIQTLSSVDDSSENKKSTKSVLRLLWKDFTTAFSDNYTLKWSLWWAFATCGFFQVVNYIQPLWEALEPDSENVYNGGVEALHALLGALTTLAVGYLSIDWSVYGEPTIAVISLFEGVMLFVAGNTDVVWVTYTTYIAFCLSYRILITIASSEVAKGLKRESYGFIFGFNTFLALLFQSILTLCVTDGVGLALDPQTQFKIYGGFFGVLGAIFSAMAAYSIFQHRSRVCVSKTICARHVPCDSPTRNDSSNSKV